MHRFETTAPGPPSADDRPQVLCVDDEPAVLEGLRDTLRRDFDVHLAAGGSDGLGLLRRHPRRFAVIVSDMRMPGMSGAEFLGEARRVAPLATRMLLTGHADVEAAMRAVNEGQIFRFLAKPCDPGELIQACTSALWQHRVWATERALSEELLSGCVRALTEALRLACPPAFARGQRVKALLQPFLAGVGMHDGWEIEAAAMLADVGAMSLPAAVAGKLYAGEPLTAAEATATERVPAMSERILAEMPRLEGVRQILGHCHRRFDSIASEGMLPVGARMLRIVLDFDRLETGRRREPPALDVLAGRHGVYDPELLAAFARGVSSSAGRRRSPR